MRKPLLERYRAAKADSENRESETSKLLEEIRQMRERMKEVADETRVKDDLYKQLVGEYERMSKDLSRVSYTRRIMEIVFNIQRQKEDIGKILGDTWQVQKEINQLSGRLERIFTITDEQVYRDARKDEARRTAYKLLASLREVRACMCVCVCVTCAMQVRTGLMTLYQLLQVTHLEGGPHSSSEVLNFHFGSKAPCPTRFDDARFPTPPTHFITACVLFSPRTVMLWWIQSKTRAKSRGSRET